MKKFFVIALMAFILPIASSVVFAETIEGTIQGYQCVTEGKTCPIGQEDPMAAIESTFVILTNDNNYYFVNNLERDVLSRHINDRIRVEGKIDPKFRTIRVDTFEVYKDGKWRKTWDQKMQDNLWQRWYKWGSEGQESGASSN